MEERLDYGISIIKVLSSLKLSRPPLPVRSKSNLNDYVIGHEKAKSSASKSATVDKLKSDTTIERVLQRRLMQRRSTLSPQLL